MSRGRPCRGAGRGARKEVRGGSAVLEDRGVHTQAPFQAPPTRDRPCTLCFRLWCGRQWGFDVGGATLAETELEEAALGVRPGPLGAVLPWLLLAFLAGRLFARHELVAAMHQAGGEDGLGPPPPQLLPA